MQTFRDMGVIAWPLLASAVFLALQIARAVVEVRREPEAAGFRSRHTVLVWGFLSALLGVLGTVVGLFVAARSVEAAGEVSVALLGGGLQVALTSTIFGLLLLTVAIVAWLLLPILGPRHSPG